MPLNIDANPICEPSLRSIQNVVGGHFHVGVVTDHEGEVAFTTSVHPYWASLRPENDPYWRRINNLSAPKALVPATTLDPLNQEAGPALPVLNLSSMCKDQSRMYFGSPLSCSRRRTS